MDKLTKDQAQDTITACIAIMNALSHWCSHNKSHFEFESAIPKETLRHMRLVVSRLLMMLEQRGIE